MVEEQADAEEVEPNQVEVNSAPAHAENPGGQADGEKYGRQSGQTPDA